MSTLRAMIRVRELQPDDAPAITAIQSRCNRVRVDGEDGLRRDLIDAARTGVSLSFGLFDQDRLVGYLLCHGFSPTIFPGETGEALYVEDAAVLPRYRRLLPRIIRRLGSEARRRFPGSAIEADAVESVFRVWHDHPSFFARGGYAITRHADSGEMLKGEIRYLVRWQPIADWDPPVPTVEELVARLRGHAVDVDGLRYEAKVVKEERDWEALAAVWDRLLLAMPDHTIFQTHEYQRVWWRHFGGDNELCIVLLIRDGEIRGIAPLQIEVLEQYGRWLRRLGLIGSQADVIRPRLLFPEVEEGPLSRALAAYLAARGDLWDVCDFREQSAGSEALTTLESAFRSAGCLVGRSRDRGRAYLRLAGTWNEFLASRSGTLRSDIEAVGRRRAAGEVESRVADTMPEVLDQLEIHRDLDVRGREGGSGTAGSGRYFEFYRELAERVGKRRGLVVRTLSVGGRPVASTLGLCHDGVFYSLQVAHDAEAGGGSPGVWLEALELEQCFRDGFREYDFPGGYPSAESHWTSTFRATTRLHAYRRTPFFLALHTALFRVRPRIRKLMKRGSR